MWLRLQKPTIWALLLLFSLCLAAERETGQHIRCGGLQNDVTLLQSDEQAVEFVLQLEQGPLHTCEEGLRLHLPTIADDTNPQRALHIALPPSCSPVIRLMEMGCASLPGEILDCPFHGKNPAALIEDSLLQIEDLRCLRLQLNFLRTCAASSRLAQRIHVRVEFVEQEARSAGSFSRMSPLEIHTLFLNGYQIGAWAETRALRRDDPVSWDGDTWLRIPVSEEGLYQIRPSLLEGLDLDASSMNPATFKLYSYGGRQIDRHPESERALEFRPKEVPMIRELDVEPGFTGQERLLFYGRGTKGLRHLSDGSLQQYSHYYADENCYYLLLGGQQEGLGMPTMPEELPGAQPLEQATWRMVIQEHKNYADTDPSLCYGDEFQGRSSHEYSFHSPAMTGADMHLEWSFYCETGGRDQGILFELDDQALAEPQAANMGTCVLDVTRDLTAGQHILRVSLQESNGKRLLLRHLVLRYQAPPVFVNGELHVESPSSPGDYSFELGDFPAGAYVLDVTDDDSLCVTHSNQIFSSVSPIIPGSTLGTTRVYYGSSDAALRTPQGVCVDHMPDLKAEAGSSELIVIAPEAYTGVMQELVDFKNASTQTSARQVSLEDVYREFNCGVVDPGAVRNFLLHEYTQATPAEYVLLVGNGHYDYRGLISGATPMVFPVWYTGAEMVDDFFVRIDGINHLGFALGRLPVSNVSEAQQLVEKLIAYESRSYAGAWHNRLLFVADDEHGKNHIVSFSEFDHSTDTETLVSHYVPQRFDVRKLFSFEYPSVYNPEIRVYEKPEAERALLDEINAGLLLVNYMGHANLTTWSHEYILHQSRHLSQIQANHQPAVYVALACGWAEIDLPVGRAMSQEMLLMPDGGAIAVVAGSRETSGPANFDMACDFYPVLFQHFNSDQQQASIAQALQYAKNQNPFSETRELYLFLGDPSLKPAFPLGGGEVERLLSANVETDTLLTTELAVIQAGTAAPADGNLVINGAASVMVREAPVSRVHAYDAIDGQAEYHGVSLEYEKAGPRMYRGSLPVEDASINARFVVPVDYSGIEGNGRIHMYYSGVDAMGDHGEGVIYYDDFAFDYNPDPQEDTTSPAVELWFNSVQWRPEDWIAANSTLVVQISDSSGVNITGEVGHRIELVLDGGQPIDLTDAFEYDTESWTSGQATTQLPQLEAGRHELRVRAFDSFNNPGYAESEFYVASEGAITLGSVVNFPIPLKRPRSSPSQ